MIFACSLSLSLTYLTIIFFMICACTLEVGGSCWTFYYGKWKARMSGYTGGMNIFKNY
jgi:hypothetical protein